MTRSRPLEPGDEFVAVKSGLRIRVVGDVAHAKVDVVTVLPDGREVRRRPLEASQLHDSATTRDGTARRNGYVLDQKETSS